ncbi:MAG: hypothetical protein V7L14_27295 [Nostoc sp.]|uniref:hypothetical protein n=1 Tax=Nostoc sp. TaxID=1180 RepID=UPI002FF744D5
MIFATINSFLSNPLVQALLGAILGAFITTIQNKIRNYIRLKPFHLIWDNIFDDEENIYIAVSDIPLDKFPIFKQNSTSQLPNNVSLLGVQEAVGLAELRQAMKIAYPNKKIYPDISRDFNFYTSSFISVGGPSVNSTTYEILINSKLKNQIEIVYPEHYAIDKKNNVEYKPDLIRNEIKEDYGFIIVNRNPFNPNKTVCLFFGVWPQGTRAAIQTMIELNVKEKYVRQLTKLIKRKCPILVIVKTKVVGLVQGTPEIVLLRELID